MLRVRKTRDEVRSSETPVRAGMYQCPVAETMLLMPLYFGAGNLRSEMGSMAPTCVKLISGIML